MSIHKLHPLYIHYDISEEFIGKTLQKGFPDFGESAHDFAKIIKEFLPDS